MKIITVTGVKGGVGKSTTAVHLAKYFSRKEKTILVDGDRNRTALEWAKRGALPFTVVQLDSPVSGDVCIIDTPARPKEKDIQEIAKSSLIILPTCPDVLSLMPTLELARQFANLGGNYRVLLTIVPPYPNKDAIAIQENLEEAGIPVFKSMIRRSTGFHHAALKGVTVDALPSSQRKGWLDYLQLGQEMESLDHE